MSLDTAPAGGSRAVTDAEPTDLPPTPAAGLLSVGIVLLAIGTPLLAVAGYQSWWYDTHLRGTGWPEAFNAGTTLFVVAAILLVVGSVSIGVGTFRLLERSDRRAGARRFQASTDGLPPIPQ